MLILDFSKAFDKVPHLRLIEKLEYYGIRGTTKTWIKNWLTSRTQQVVVDGEKSGEEHVKSGVPQGTVLGPLMFLLYINDIGNNTSSTIRLFADDCLIYRYINNKDDSMSLQRDLDQLCLWASKWQMSFNPSKCSLMRVTKRKRPVMADYKMLGQILQCADHHPYLGVEISSDLSWSHHINNIIQSAHRTTNFLRRNISKCSVETKQAGITGMVRPILEYASSAWHPYQQNHIQKLESVQSKAARFVLNRYDQMASVTQMRQELGWPTLQTRRFITRTVLFYKIVNGLIHLQIPEYIIPKTRILRGEHQHQYTVVQTRTDVFKYSYYPRTIRCWNILPTALVDRPSVETFKTGLCSALEDGSLYLVQPKGMYDRPRLGSTSLLPGAVF